MEEKQYPFCAVYRDGDKYNWKLIPAATRGEAMQRAVHFFSRNSLVVVGIHLLHTNGYPAPEEYVDEDGLEVMIHNEAATLTNRCRELEKSAKESRKRHIRLANSRKIIKHRQGQEMQNG